MNKNENPFSSLPSSSEESDEDKLKPFDRSAVAALVEQAVRMTDGRKKSPPASRSLRISFVKPTTGRGGQILTGQEKHVDKAMRQDLSFEPHRRAHPGDDRPRTLLIDVDGEVVGQVNGLPCTAWAITCSQAFPHHGNNLHGPRRNHQYRARSGNVRKHHNKACSS